MPSHHVALPLAFCATAAVAAAPAMAQAPIVHIGAGHPYSLAQAINNRGQVVGVMNFPDDEGRFHAYVWEDGVLRDLAPFATGGSHAMDINDRGEIVGVADFGDGLGDAALWVDGQAHRLDAPADAHCFAVAINERGLIVGQCSFPTETVPVLWRNGVFERMAVPPDVYVNPVDVNDAGVVVGNASRPDLSRFPFIWVNGVLTDLNAISDRPFERVVGINRHGQIAGEGPGPDGRGQGLFWEDGTATLIQPVAGSASAIPSGLNDRGQVVGANGSGGGGFVWSRGEIRAIRVFLPGGSFAYATAINERGDVAGQTTIPQYEGLPSAILWPGAGRHHPRRVDR
jgi:probable HAF family extracellular repeat protein